MTHGSVFSGVDGPGLAALWMGWKNVFHCEYSEFQKTILEKRFKDSISYGNIKHADFSIHRGQIDVFTGGFPCQPFSTSGEQLGESDERYLFEEMFRAIREIKPRWIVAENVLGITSRKFEKTFEHICSSLENEGYQVQPYIIPATAIGAEHQRYRVWIVAHSTSVRLSGQGQLLGSMQPTKIGNRETSGFINFIHKNAMPYLCRDHDGLSRKLDESRNHALGNAIVPQVIFEIFKTIQQYENLTA